MRVRAWLETADSRAAILEAAKRLFMQDGFRGISMRQIAEAVGVTKAALYYHFQDKEELFVAIVEQYLLEMAALIDEVTAEQAGARQQISDLVQRILAQPPEQRSIIRLASQELGNLDDATRKAFVQIYHEQFIGRITALLEAGMTAASCAADPNVATWTLLGMMYPYFHPTPPTGTAPTETLVADRATALQIYFDGLLGPNPPWSVDQFATEHLRLISPHVTA